MYYQKNYCVDDLNEPQQCHARLTCDSASSTFSEVRKRKKLKQFLERSRSF